MKHLYRAALPLLAIGAIAACQQAPVSTPTAGMTISEGNGILVVNARTAGVRKVLQASTAPYPLTATDVAAVRITLKRDGSTVSTQTVANPGTTTSAAFRNLHAQSTYDVLAEAFLADPDASPTAEVVASDTESVTIDNELTPALANLILQLPNQYFDSSTSNSIQIFDGAWDYPASGVEDITATPVSS